MALLWRKGNTGYGDKHRYQHGINIARDDHRAMPRKPATFGGLLQ